MGRGNGRRISSVREFGLLTQQYAMILMGNSKDLCVTIAFPIIAAFITVWIAGEKMFVNYESTKSACFVLVSAAIWGGLFNSIQTVVKEREIIKRDMISGGMRLRCYTESRALLQMVLCAIQTAILCVSFYGVHWRYDNALPDEGILTDHPVLEFYISLFLLMFAADAMGLMISCIVKKAETASVMAPYILIVQLIFSGILFTLEGAADLVSLGMLSRWGMEALGSICNCNDLPLRMAEDYPMLVHDAEDMFLWENGHLIKVWLILAGFSIGFILIGNLVLHRVKHDSRE